MRFFETEYQALRPKKKKADYFIHPRKNLPKLLFTTLLELTFQKTVFDWKLKLTGFTK